MLKKEILSWYDKITSAINGFLLRYQESCNDLFSNKKWKKKIKNIQVY